MKQEKAITLIALVITIIVLLILAGVSIATLTGENGILNKASKAGEKTVEAQIKEEIELAIIEIQAEEISEGRNVTLETLANGQLTNKLQNITATLEGNEIIGEYKGYDYIIDDKFKVTIGEKVKGISITYELSNQEYTNQDITLTIHATSTNGEITKIQEPAELSKNNDGTYTITKNGEYEFIFMDSIGQVKKQLIKITTIDKIEPKAFTPTVLEVGVKRIKIEAKTQDEEETLESAQSGIEKYEYYVNGAKVDETNEEIHELTNLSKNTTYTIYVIAHDKAGNKKQSETISVTTISGDYPTLRLNKMQAGEDMAVDALPAVAYDNNFSTYAVAVHNNKRTLYLKVDPECWGKYITLYNVNNSSTLGGSIGFNKTTDKTGEYEGGWVSNFCGLISGNKCARSVLIPEGTYWISLGSGTSNTKVSNYIYEVWCSEEDLTGKTY